MLATIVLDQRYPHFTNLDIISGKVYIRAESSSSVSNILVKLEGESRTRLMPPPTPEHGDRKHPQLEFHKILYQIQMVFPPPNVKTIPGDKTVYTLPPGQHEYPFSFKFPFNNNCNPAKSATPTISLFGGLSVEVVKQQHPHVKKTLPPTLTGFPGEAEIRYFVKATVNRPSLFRENARALVPFNFNPIEPPRPAPSAAQCYARRRFEFADPGPAGLLSKGKAKGLFGKKTAESVATGTSAAPSIAVDARLPEPAILTCARDIPLNILISSLNGVTEGLSVQSLQIELIASTHIRAQDVGRIERNSTIIVSTSNLGVPIRFPTGGDAEIDNSLWRGRAMPNTIPPSFETCNISRSYEVITRIGIRFSPAGHQPQFTTIDLKLPVQIYSGIAPPPALLEAMANRDRLNAPPALPARKPSKSAGMVPPPHTPAPGPAPSSSAAPPPAFDAPPPVYSEAPPSYEDAVAQNLAPIEGPRRDYAPPVAAEDPLLGRDEKSGWH